MPPKRKHLGPVPGHCPRCGAEKIVSHGKLGNVMRWHCLEGCGRYFSDTTPDTSAHVPLTLGRYLRRLRRQADLRTDDVMKATSVSGAFLSLLERGKRTVSLPVLREIVEFLKGDWPTAHGLWLEALYNGSVPEVIAPESLSKLGQRRFERCHGRIFARPHGNGWRYREVRAGYEDKIPSLFERGYREVCPRGIQRSDKNV